jgi:anti-sigma regulatory factor (Ser/Thr protein kinase)
MRGRSYILGPVRNHTEVLPLAGLSESKVYYGESGFMFSDLPKEIENICHYGFTEMLNNAIEHSGGQQAAVCVERSLTTDPDNHGGQGIFFTSRVFDKFYIASGD